MAPRKRGARKRMSENALGGEKEGEENEERKRKDRGNKKYIGAHVGIQGITSWFCDCHLGI